MTTSRRDFIVGTGAAIALANLPARAVERCRRRGRKLLAELPKSCWSTIPKARPAWASTRASAAASRRSCQDRSAAGQQAIAQRVAKRLERLKPSTLLALGEAARIDVDVVRTAHEFAAQGFAFPYGDTALLNSSWSYRNAPYVVAQNTGAFLEIPSMLDKQHTVETKADADAYLSRLEAYAGQLDGETERLKCRGCAGRDRAGLPARQDAGADQARARRQDRRLVARARRSRRRTKNMSRRLRSESNQDRDGQSCAGARPPDRRAGSASQARDQRCRRVEAAARRCVLRVGADAPVRRRG